MRWLALWFAASLLASPPEAVEGLWYAPANPQDGDGIVEIRRQGEGLVGRLVWLEKPTYPAGSSGAGLPKADRKNPDPALRGRPVLGLVILRGFRWDGARWVGGAVYDPVSGKTYKAQLTMEGPDRLRLRGYLGIPLLGRTEVWTRVDKLPENRGQALPGFQP